jgi:hypothetical protein
MHRYYQNRLGRFSSPDPLAGHLPNPQSLNRYAYVQNDPVDSVDPLGLYCIPGHCPGDPEPDGPEVDILGASQSSDNFFDRAAEFGGIFRNWFFYSGVTGRAPLKSRDQERFDENREKLLEQLNQFTEECLALLGKLGVTAASVRQAVASQVPWDGKNSTISNAQAGTFGGPRPTEPQAAAAYDYMMNAPVSASFRDSGGSTVWALAQLGGHDVYYRPGGPFSTQSVQPGRILHEALHNLGKTDEDIQGAWGLPTGGSTNNITQSLIQAGCVRD